MGMEINGNSYGSYANGYNGTNAVKDPSAASEKTPATGAAAKKDVGKSTADYYSDLQKNYDSGTLSRLSVRKRRTRIVYAENRQ